MTAHRLAKLALLGGVAMLPALTAMPTAAQTATQGAPAAPETGLSAAIDESSADIIVTARKTEERLQEVPVAITAFTSADIKSARIENLADLAKLTPGLNYTPLFGRQNQLPIIRGAAQTFGQLNVGVFLDGIYLSGKAAVDLELNDLERIEVVRGPQSALYGRNTFAGAINYVTKRPSAEPSGNIEATLGTRGLVKGIASISGPLADNVRVRIGGYYREMDGFYRSAIDGGRVDFSEAWGVTGTLELTPTEALTVTLRGTYSDEDSGQPPSSVIRNNAFPGQPAGSTPTLPPRLSTIRNLLFVGRVPAIPRRGVTVNTVASPFQIGEFGDREEATRLSGTIEYDFGPVTATSLTSYAKRNSEYTFDGDNTVCDLSPGCPNFGYPFTPLIATGASQFALSSQDGFSRDFSQELRLQSNGRSGFNWLIGAFYYDNKTSALDRSLAPVTAAARDAFTFLRGTTTTKSYALFASVGVALTERLKLSGELRYEYEDQSFVQFPTRNVPPVLPNPVPAGLRSYDLKQNFDFVTPRVILDWQATPDALLYASYARGAKTGGFNTNTNVFDDQRTYDPETSNNFELGVKSDWLDDRLRINLAGYFIDWNDQQAACQNPLTAGGSSTQRTYTCNVAASTIYGAELEVLARFSDAFSVAGSYTWTHARYDRFVDDSLAAVLALLRQPPLDFDGKRLPYVPDHKLVVSPRLELPLGDALSAEARADVQYQSTSYLRADNLQNFGKKTVVDLRLLLRHDSGVSLQLFANNVFDDKRPVAGVRFFDSVNFSVASPLIQGANRRQLGATLGYRF